MSHTNDDFEAYEVASEANKNARQKRFETQKRIYELKEKHKLKREQRDYFDDDSYDEEYDVYF